MLAGGPEIWSDRATIMEQRMALEDAKTQVDTAFTREDRRGLAYENAFGGAVSFLRRRYSKDLTGADIAVTGAPRFSACKSWSSASTD